MLFFAGVPSLYSFFAWPLKVAFYLPLAAGMADLVPQRPIRAGSLSHSATATIHHANLEHEHGAQVCHSLLYYTLMSKTVKSLLLTTLDTSFRRKTPIIREMGHQLGGMEGATGLASVGFG